MAITIDPMAVSNFSDSFHLRFTGGHQGQVVETSISGVHKTSGKVDPTATKPLWTGLAIQEFMPAGTADELVGFGSYIKRAATLAAVDGFIIWNGNNNAYTFAGSDVGQLPAKETGVYVRKGTGQRIHLAADDALVEALVTSGWNNTTQMSIDLVDTNPTYGQLIEYDALLGAVPFRIISVHYQESLVVSYDSVTGHANFVQGSTIQVII